MNKDEMIIKDEYQFNQEVRRRITELCGSEYILANLKQEICMYVMQMYKAGYKAHESDTNHTEAIFTKEDMWKEPDFEWIECGETRFKLPIPEPTIDDIARMEAIAFADYCEKDYFSNGNGEWRKDTDSGGKRYTTSELYQIYLTSKQGK